MTAVDKILSRSADECGYCGKLAADVRHVVTGPGKDKCICDECAEAILFGFEHAGVTLSSVRTIDSESLDRIKELEGEVARFREIMVVGIQWAEDAQYSLSLTPKDINEMLELSDKPLSPEVRAALPSSYTTLQCDKCGAFTQIVRGEHDIEDCCDGGHWIEE